ncbi:MAG: metal-dependent hydrolase [Candidatus Binatia bacterium]|nr:metal-dependent hydrolase [Candidatus Binatia bacterium]
MATPAHLDIEQRDLHFEFSPEELRSWHPDGPHVAHLFNAMSVFFPEGEKLFIEAVRHYRDRIDDPQLSADVQAFVGQEAMHSREHRRYNQALADAGLPVAKLEGWLKGFLGRLKTRTSPMERLAITIALEHFTAIMAGQVLADDSLGRDNEVANAWRWHAVEETEHKAVAFDVYQEVSKRPVQAYLLRSVVMLSSSAIFWFLVFRFHFALVKADGLAGDVRGWLAFGRFLWLRPGMLRRLIAPWAHYFRPGFHPWQEDNHKVVDEWKAELDPA